LLPLQFKGAGARRRAHFLLFLLFLIPFLTPRSSFSQLTFFEAGFPTLTGPDAVPYIDTPTRFKIDLSGQWEYDAGGGIRGTVRIPGAYAFSGPVTFSRQFELSPGLLDTTQLHLVALGITNTCEIYVNGEFLASHGGGGTSLTVRVPGNMVQVGRENVVRIAVTNVLDPRRSIPLKQQVGDARTYGGIVRDLYLLATPRTYIGDVVAASTVLPSGTEARLRVTAVIEGRQAAVPSGSTPVVWFDVVEKLSGITVASSKPVPVVVGESDWQVPAAEVSIGGFKPWSPATPDLYVVRTRLGIQTGNEVGVLDQHDMNIGIRKISITGGDILLNGVRIVLKGVTWIEDHPVRGSALSYEDRERDIIMIKALGANAVRFAGHPPHPYMLNLCDRYGLLALVDAPIAGAPGAIMADEALLEMASSAVRQMIIRDRNHASVLGWGLADDCDPVAPAGLAFVDSLARLARSLDARPVYGSFRLVPGDSASGLVDLAGLNVGPGDLKSFKSLIADWRALHRTKPVFVARMGMEVRHDNRQGYSDPLSQQAQARYLLQRFDALRTEDYDGGFVRSFNDARAARPSLQAENGDALLLSYGLASEGREKRIAYDAVRSVFNGEKFAALPIGAYAPGSPMVYILVGFVLLVGVAYLYNANRRFRESLSRSVLSVYNFFSDVRDQHLVSSIQSTLLGMATAIAFAVVCSSILHHFRSSPVVDQALSILLVTDGAKTAAIRLIRDPALALVYIALAVFVTYLAITLLILLLRLLVKVRVYPYHAYSVTMWSTAPMLLLIPIGMVLYRVIETSAYVIPAIVVVVLVLLWVYFRMLKGVSIMYDAPAFRVYLVGVLLVAGAGGLLYAYFNVVHAAPEYFGYLYQQFVGAR
jgi:hypothetical protein